MDPIEFLSRCDAVVELVKAGLPLDPVSEKFVVKTFSGLFSIFFKFHRNSIFSSLDRSFAPDTEVVTSWLNVECGAKDVDLRFQSLQGALRFSASLLRQPPANGSIEVLTCTFLPHLCSRARFLVSFCYKFLY